MFLWFASTATAFDVVVSGVVGAGTIGCAAFTSAEGFPGQVDKAVGIAAVPAAEAEEGKLTCRFPDLGPGRYAISVRHDVNDNGKLDTTLVGFPKEPFGFSRNAPLRTFGPPKFDDVVITIPDASKPVPVTLTSPK